MNDDAKDRQEYGRDGALQALLEVAHSRQAKEGSLTDSVFSTRDYEVLVDLAWRHQFDTDRGEFRRGIRSLQEQVVPRILEHLETLAGAQ
jgi:hypothetical protein